MSKHKLKYSIKVTKINGHYNATLIFHEMDEKLRHCNTEIEDSNIAVVGGSSGPPSSNDNAAIIMPGIHSNKFPIHLPTRIKYNSQESAEEDANEMNRAIKKWHKQAIHELTTT